MRKFDIVVDSILTSSCQHTTYNFQATDVSQSYDLFVPAVKLNQRDRAKCLLLRAKALKKMGYPREAENEALAAINLDPTISEWNMDD